MSKEQVRKYFNSWANEYNNAVSGNSGKGNFLQELINRAYRNETFAKRNKQITQILTELDLSGKQVLDVGCGIGHLSLFCGSRGACVTGIDISKNMVEIARQNLKKTELQADKVNFVTGDLTNKRLKSYQIVLCVAVLEYYPTGDLLASKLSASCEQYLLICLPRGNLLRRLLRKLLAQIKNFPIFYHDPKTIIAAAQLEGMECIGNWPMHSFHTLLFERPKANII